MMTDKKKVIQDLNTAKYFLISPPMFNPGICIRIGQAITSAIDLLEEQEEQVMPVDTKVIGTERGDVEVYCCRACKFQLDPTFNFCPNCGKEVIWDDRQRKNY